MLHSIRWTSEKIAQRPTHRNTSWDWGQIWHKRPAVDGHYLRIAIKPFQIVTLHLELYVSSQ